MYQNRLRNFFTPPPELTNNLAHYLRTTNLLSLQHFDYNESIFIGDGGVIMICSAN
jgi:hypothetical protein